jgi:hypothetical protein
MAAAICLGATLTLHAAENRGADQIQIHGGSRGEVPFPHHLHQDTLQECNICHATFPQQTGAIDTLKQEGKLARKQVMNKLCTKCHREKKAAGEKTGPTTCNKCHQRN